MSADRTYIDYLADIHGSAAILWSTIWGGFDYFSEAA
jgi:hypothetical protein